MENNKKKKNGMHEFKFESLVFNLTKLGKLKSHASTAMFHYYNILRAILCKIRTLYKSRGHRTSSI